MGVGRPVVAVSQEGTPIAVIAKISSTRRALEHQGRDLRRRPGSGELTEEEAFFDRSGRRVRCSGPVVLPGPGLRGYLGGAAGGTKAVAVLGHEIFRQLVEVGVLEQQGAAQAGHPLLQVFDHPQGDDGIDAVFRERLAHVELGFGQF